MFNTKKLENLVALFFLIVLVVYAVISIFNLNNSFAIDKEIMNLLEEVTPSYNMASNINDELMSIDIAISKFDDITLLYNKDISEKTQGDIKDHIESIDAKIKEYEKLNKDADNNQITQFKNNFLEYRKFLDKFLKKISIMSAQHATSGVVAESEKNIKNLEKENNQKKVASNKSIDKLLDTEFKNMMNKERMIDKAGASQKNFSIFSLIFGVLLILVFIYILYKKVKGIRIKGEEQQEYINNVLNSIGAPMFVVDENLVVKFVNDPLLDALGESRDEVVGKMKCAALCKTPLCNSSNCTIKRAWESHSIIDADTEATKRDGSKLPISATCTALFDKNGKPIGGMEVMTDLTEVKSTISEVEKIVDFAIKGELDKRAVVTNQTGDYKKLLDKTNQLLQAIIEPINDTINLLEKAANKDVSNLIDEEKYSGYFRRLARNINSTFGAISDALSVIEGSSNEIENASSQVAQGSQQLAQAANEQASSIEEISSSLEELDSMSKQNLENANNAKNVIGDLVTTATSGKGLMNTLQIAIDKIKESSDQTANIVKTIDEIAFQTNILALNAAVEAARAGDAGKGFAVVAEEVRSLAQRSAEAAKKTAEMISESTNLSNKGQKQGQDATSAFEEVEKQVQNVSVLVEEIALASNEQEKGVEQINVGVQQMNIAVQQISANSEESASASEELNGQAQEVKALVGEFELAETDLGAKKQKTNVKKHSNTTKIKMDNNSGLKKLNSKKQNDEIIPLDEDDLKGF